MLSLQKIFCISLLLSLISTIYASKNEEQKRIFDKIFDNITYDKSVRPKCDALSIDESAGDKPCIVNASVIIRSISDIDEKKMVYSVQMFVRTVWDDKRLNYQSLLNSNQSKTKLPVNFLLLTDISKIWTPKIYIPAYFNQRTASDDRLQINPDGGVTHSSVISLTRSCSMNLKYFPFDTQVCDIIITSYSYTIDDIKFKWMSKDAVKNARKFTLPRFNLSHCEKSEYNVTADGSPFSGLRLTFHFKREYGYYVIQFYIPCALLVLISWLSFWLDEIPTEARLSLVVTTLITLTLLIVAINSTLPTTSYIKMMDVYTGTCLMFVIATVFQYTISTLAAIKEERNHQKLEKEGLSKREIESKKCNLENSDAVNIKFTAEFGKSAKFRKCRNRLLATDKSTSKRIDNASKILFPFLFIIFIIAYCVFLPRD